MTDEKPEEKVQNDENTTGGLDDDDQETIILISSDEPNPQRFELTKKGAIMCNLVKSILDGDANAKEIPIKKSSRRNISFNCGIFKKTQRQKTSRNCKTNTKC